MPRQLLRGRRVRALVRTRGCRPRPSGRTRRARRPRVGSSISTRCTRRASERARLALRRRVAVDRVRVPPVPALPPAAGAVGEYNGKFMVNQHVLRGGCCATPAGHARPTYRNFFPPSARWAFSGVRLARDARREDRLMTNGADVDRRRPPAAGSPARRDGRRRRTRPHRRSEDAAAGVVLRRAGQRALRRDHAPARVLPDRAERSILAAHAGEIVASPAPTCSSSSVRERPRRRGCCSTRWRTRDRCALRALRRQRGDACARARPSITDAYDVPVHAIVGDFHRHLATIPRGDGGSSRSSAARSATSIPRSAAVLLRSRHDARPRRLVAARHRPGEGPGPARRRVRRRGRRHRGVQPERPRRAQPRARCALRSRRVRTRRRVGRATSSGSRCGCGRTIDQIVAIDELALKVQFDAGEEMRTEIAAKFTEEQVQQELWD